MSNEKKSSEALARSLDNNLMEASTRLKGKAKILKAILEEANTVYLAPDELKKLSQEDQTKAAKQMEDIGAKLSLAIKSLERWRNHYQNTVEITKKAKEALSNSKQYKTHEDRSQVGSSLASPPKPAIDKTPPSMRRKVEEPAAKTEDPKLTDDDQSPRKQ